MSITFSFYSCIIREKFAVVRMLPFNLSWLPQMNETNIFFIVHQIKLNPINHFNEFYYVKNNTVDLSENPLIKYKIMQ